jgi:hypothetical protein
VFIAFDKLHNQELRKAIITVPERAIGASFANEPLSKFVFRAAWHVEPKWNLCNAVEKFGVEAFDDCLIAVDEFHHVWTNPDNNLLRYLY